MTDSIKYTLDESRIPTTWYNLMADLPSLIEGMSEGAQRTVDIVNGLRRFSAVDREERVAVDLAAQQRGQRLGGLLEGHVNDVDPGHHPEHLAGKVVGEPRARGREADPAGLGAGERDQFLHAGRLQRRVHDDDVRERDGERHRREVA